MSSIIKALLTPLAFVVGLVASLFFAALLLVYLPFECVCSLWGEEENGI